VLVVGFGSQREWLHAFARALRYGDQDALSWLRDAGGPAPSPPQGPRLGAPDVRFTGRLDHRYAPGALAAMDVLVVPSILDEAFGMVAAEGAAAGAMPLVARHSGLAEIASALEQAVGRPGLFSFEPRVDAVGALTDGLDRLLSLPAAERQELRARVARFAAGEWSWRRTAHRVLEAAARGRTPLRYSDRADDT
jgi:glycosyltransferase involved in cell wall biosynthesis